MEHFPITDRLHTDVLQDHFGPIHAKVITHTKRLRASHLVTKRGVSRTFALTFFPKSWGTQELATVNEEIRKGGLIGVSFRKHGYAIRKNVIDVYVVRLPDWLKHDFRTKAVFAKARLSEFYAKKDTGKPHLYGTVVEIYAPAFRKPVVNTVDYAQINATTKVLRWVGITESELWRRLGRNNDWSGKMALRERARQLSLRDVSKFRKRIDEYLWKHSLTKTI